MAGQLCWAAARGDTRQIISVTVVICFHDSERWTGASFGAEMASRPQWDSVWCSRVSAGAYRISKDLNTFILYLKRVKWCNQCVTLLSRALNMPSSPPPANLSVTTAQLCGVGFTLYRYMEVLLTSLFWKQIYITWSQEKGGTSLAVGKWVVPLFSACGR